MVVAIGFAAGPVNWIVQPKGGDFFGAQETPVPFVIECGCGNPLVVGAGSAGASVRCDCGQVTVVPALHELRSLPAAVEEEAPAGDRAASTAQVLLWLIGASAATLYLLLVGGWAFSEGIPPGIAFFAGALAYVWMVALIARECHPNALALALLVPFFTWYFAFQRWDIAKWPFVVSVAALIVNLAVAAERLAR